LQSIFCEQRVRAVDKSDLIVTNSYLELKKNYVLY